MRNLSLSGALIEADHELRLHANIEVCIELPETGRSAMRIMARVTRELEGAIGLEWREFAPSKYGDDNIRFPCFHPRFQQPQ
jgi:hypothetical protein